MNDGSIRRRAAVAVTALLAAGCLGAAPALAQPAPASPPPSAMAKPGFDLTGTWWIAVERGSLGVFKPDPPLKPEAMKVWEEVNTRRASGENFRDKSGLCLPEGMPLILTRVYPIEVHQSAKMITIIYEYENNVRWIYVDGRPHPKPDDLIPTYMGHSIGHWEGDTLVVDTVGMNTEPDIEPGVPHTDKLHIVERMKLTPDGFVDQLTMDDPNILTKPWESRVIYKKSAAELEEYHCLPENNHFTVDADGVLRPH